MVPEVQLLLTVQYCATKLTIELALELALVVP